VSRGSISGYWCLLYSVQIGPVTHPDSQFPSGGVCSRGSKDHLLLTSSSDEVNNEEAIPPLHHTPSWRAEGQLKLCLYWEEKVEYKSRPLSCCVLAPSSRNVSPVLFSEAGSEPVAVLGLNTGRGLRRQNGLLLGFVLTGGLRAATVQMSAACFILKQFTTFALNVKPNYNKHIKTETDIACFVFSVCFRLICYRKELLYTVREISTSKMHTYR
jgi:hypothetical protein